MVDDFEDLLGDEADLGETNDAAEAFDSRVEARRARREARRQEREEAGEVDTRLEQVVKGVSATWLSKALRMDLAQVKQRLSSVTPMHGAKNQAHYDMKVAMPHLVDPIVDVEEYIRTMDKKNLPPSMTEAFWRGMKTRLDALEKAKQLWPTIKVVEGFGIVFKLLRGQTNLWVDTLDEQEEMSDAQRELILTLIDALYEDIYNALHDFTKEHATRTELEWLEDYLNENG